MLHDGAQLGQSGLGEPSNKKKPAKTGENFQTLRDPSTPVWIGN